MQRLTCIQHEELVEPAGIADWAVDRGWECNVVHAPDVDTWPTPGAGEAWIVLGGSMNVDDVDEHPWINDELKFLGAAVDARARLLGICLGAQLLATVLGARVGAAAHKERGFWPVELTDAGRGLEAFAAAGSPPPMFQAHTQTFALPPRAVHLAASDAVENQAFAFRDDVLGVQFHPEFTQAQVQALHEQRPVDWRGEYVQHPEDYLDDSRSFDDMHEWLCRLLDAFFMTGATDAAAPGSARSATVSDTGGHA